MQGSGIFGKITRTGIDIRELQLVEIHLLTKPARISPGSAGGSSLQMKQEGKIWHPNLRIWKA